MTNLFELEPSPKIKKTKTLEADSLTEVLQALRTHHTVAWVRRQNTGAAKVGGRFIKFGWTGCTDKRTSYPWLINLEAVLLLPPAP